MRVVITGIGLVTPLGRSVSENVDRCLQGVSAIEPIRRFGSNGHGCRAASYVAGFELGSGLRYPKNTKFMGEGVRCAMQAAREAIAGSGIDWGNLNPERIALYTGSGQPGLEYEEYFTALEAAWEGDREQDFKYLGGLPSRLIDRYIVLRSLANGGLGLLSTEFGICGPSTNIAQTDCASAHALSCAFHDLLEDRCDAALVGGYDSLLGSSNFLAYDKNGLLSSLSHEDACRPFDRRRDGFVLGTGAGFVFLERHDDALDRGATILAEIDAVESNWDMDGPVDFVAARGIATQAGDTHEAQTIETSFGSQTPVIAFKGLTGYLGAASALVELVLGLACARQGLLPHIARCTEPDSNFDLNFVRERSRPVPCQNPLGLFLSGSWTGQSARILARAVSV